MMEAARSALQQTFGVEVLAGWISPTHDGYVKGKCRSKGIPWVDAQERVAMCQAALAHSPWLRAGRCAFRHFHSQPHTKPAPCPMPWRKGFSECVVH